MNIYFDTEFTGLVPNTTLISIGCITENGETFYAEFTDYDESLCDDWIKENVLKNLKFGPYHTEVVEGLGRINNTGNPWFDNTFEGDSKYIKEMLTRWLKIVNPNNERIQFVSDVCHYDFYLLCNLFGGAFLLPENVNPVCYDICQDIKHDLNESISFADGMYNAFDISREDFLLETLGMWLPEGNKHNALYDAEVIKMIYEGINR